MERVSDYIVHETQWMRFVRTEYRHVDRDTDIRYIEESLHKAILSTKPRQFITHKIFHLVPVLIEA